MTRFLAFCFALCLFGQPMIGFGQDETAAPDAPETLEERIPTVSLICPPGMALVPSMKIRDGEMQEAFCIDLFEYPNEIGVMPILDISWIEAESLCFKAGKRLCTSGEWQSACQGPAQTAYPYGVSYFPETCNTEQEWMMNGSKAFPSGTFPGCVSGYGVLDMSGNVSEWTTSDTESAVIFGGSWLSGRFSTCRSSYTLDKSVRYVFNGARCCKAPAIEIK